MVERDKKAAGDQHRIILPVKRAGTAQTSEPQIKRADRFQGRKIDMLSFAGPVPVFKRRERRKGGIKPRDASHFLPTARRAGWFLRGQTVLAKTGP